MWRAEPPSVADLQALVAAHGAVFFALRDRPAVVDESSPIAGFAWCAIRAWPKGEPGGFLEVECYAFDEHGQRFSSRDLSFMLWCPMSRSTGALLAWPVAQG